MFAQKKQDLQEVQKNTKRPEVSNQQDKNPKR